MEKFCITILIFSFYCCLVTSHTYPRMRILLRASTKITLLLISQSKGRAYALITLCVCVFLCKSFFSLDQDTITVFGHHTNYKCFSFLFSVQIITIILSNIKLLLLKLNMFSRILYVRRNLNRIFVLFSLCLHSPHKS